MSPLDEELHDALHARAASLAAPPDPMAGIEQRARGLRRRRTMLATAGAAVALALVAVTASTLLLQDAPTSRLTPATGAEDSATLDPGQPWTFRGTPVDPAALRPLRQEWAKQHPGSTLTPLFSQVYESSGQVELAFVATGGDGNRYGYAWLGGSVGRDTFAVDRELPVDSKALAFLLPGDEVQRLLVVAGPRSRSLEFSADGTTFSAMVEPPTGNAQGIGGVPFEGNLSAPRVRVTGADGSIVYDEPVDAGEKNGPANLLSSWPQRGSSAHAPGEAAVLEAFAASMGRSLADARYRSLFVGETRGGVAFTVGQAWLVGGGEAYNVSYTTGTYDGPDFFLGKPTPSQPAVLAFLVSNTVDTRDLLVVVPQPQTGQVLYDNDGSGAFTPVTGQDLLDGVVLIDRARNATNDRLELLDGNGNLDVPTYKGPVAPLLCGLKECG